jgi:hypothetical protein
MATTCITLAIVAAGPVPRKRHLLQGHSLIASANAVVTPSRLKHGPRITFLIQAFHYYICAAQDGRELSQAHDLWRFFRRQAFDFTTIKMPLTFSHNMD